MSILTVLIPLAEAFAIKVATLLGLEALINGAVLDCTSILLHLHGLLLLLHHLLLRCCHLLLHILLAHHLLLRWVEHLLLLGLLVGHTLGGLGVELGLWLAGPWLLGLYSRVVGLLLLYWLSLLL